MTFTKISFSGIENPICVDSDAVTVMEVNNTVLFSRVCQSLLSELAEESLEPYTLWDVKGKRINPKGAFLLCNDVFNLPWDSRMLTSKLFGVIEDALFENEECRVNVEEFNHKITLAIEQLSFQMDADYSFRVEWALSQYLKAFGFSPSRRSDATLFENLIQFIDFASDMNLAKPAMFINLKIFLTEKQLQEFFERLFFHGMSCLLIENQHCDTLLNHEKKIVVEQDFVEYFAQGQSDCTSLSQEGFCANSFGTVTF